MRPGTIGDRFAEVAFAARRLRRTPLFTIVAILLLGIGMAIAAATASLLNVALFKDAARDRGLVHVAAHLYVSNLPDEAVRQMLANPPRSFDALAGFGLTRATAVVDGVSRPVATEAVTGPYFSLLEAVPLAGRLIDDADNRDSALVAVISKSFWQSAFGSRPDVVGTSITVAGQRLTVVGAVERPVRPGARGADLWVPSRVMPVDRLFGRLRRGVEIEQANAEMSARYGRFDADGASRALVVREGLSDPISANYVLDLIWAASLAVGVSLVASVSFGLLLFARMAATESTMAVRIALGATARDLTRLLAAEVVLMALAATVVAVNAGSLLSHFVAAQVIEMSGMSAAIDTSPDWRVFLAVGGLTLTVALLVVARLSWSVVRVEALGSMVATGGLGGATIRTAHTSTRLVIAQSAATAALLLVAALFIRNTFSASASVGDLDASGIIAWIDTAVPGSATSRARSVLDVATRMPGVSQAALVSSLPGSSSMGSVVLNEAGERRSPDVRYVSADAFEVLNLALARGRRFTAREDEEGAPVAVVSDTAARKFWPSMDPIGRRMWVQRTRETALEILVIGVVTDSPWRSGARATRREDVYLPFAHRPDDLAFSRRLDISGAALITLGDGDADRRLDLFRSSLQRAFPDTGFVSVRTTRQEMAERLAPPTPIARVVGVLGLIVFVVAMGGLYGLMSYLATMRRREMGIRKALGATSMALCRMLVRESTPMLGAGVGIGLLGGLMIGSFFVRSSNFRLLDPVAIAGVAAFLYAVGLVGATAPYLRTLREVTARLRD